MLENYGIYVIIEEQFEIFVSLAQLVEQLTLNQWVWGSNPQGDTNFEIGLVAQLVRAHA